MYATRAQHPVWRSSFFPRALFNFRPVFIEIRFFMQRGRAGKRKNLYQNIRVSFGNISRGITKFARARNKRIKGKVRLSFTCISSNVHYI